ncbi:hypothetical protein [Clostridium sp. C2-6-12]|nr:hypothetical protein [Clostridium sp. C2-6-12]
MLLKILDNMIFLLGSIRNNIVDKYYSSEEDDSWMDELAEAYEKYGML